MPFDFPPVGLWWCTNDDNRLNSSINELPVSLYDSTFTLLGSFEKCQCEQELKMQPLILPYTKLTELQVGKHPVYRRSQLTLFVGVQDGGLKKVALSGLTDAGSWRDIESLETLSVWLTSWMREEKKTRITSRIWLDGRITSVAVVLNGKLCSSLLAREQITTVYYLLGCCWTKQCVT